MKIKRYNENIGLNHCKVCGSEYASYFLEYIGGMAVPTFQCSNCGAKVSRESKELAIEAWNNGEVSQQ